MKQITTSVCGFDLPVSGVPENLQEAVQVCGGEPQAVDIIVNHVKYHRTNTEIRSAISEAITKITGVERETEKVPAPTKEDPNKTVEKWAESEQTHVNRALAEKGLKIADVAEQVAAAVGVTEFKAVGEPRTAGPGRMAKMYTENAQTLINAGQATWSGAVEKLQQKNPGLTIALDENGVPTVESLAAALKTNRVRVEKEENAALGIAA